MSNFSKYDIVVVNFPFIDKLRKYKVRPAVIVSNDNYHNNTGFVLLAMITTAKNSQMWGDIPISSPELLELDTSPPLE